MAGKCGKRQIEETDELSFLPSAIKKDRSRRRRLQMQLAQPKTIFEFGLPSIVAYSQRNITVPRPVPSCGGFLQDSFILSLSLKTMTRSTHRTACFPTRYTLIVFKYGTPHTKVVYAHQASLFRALETRGTHIFPLFPLFLPFCSKKIKTSWVHMTKIGNVQNSG